MARRLDERPRCTPGVGHVAHGVRLGMASTHTEHPTIRLVDELRRVWAVLIVLPLMILATWGAGALITRSRIDQWDKDFERRLADNRIGWINTATKWGTWLAETIPVIVILLLAVVIARRVTGAWRAPLFMVLAVGGEKLIYLLSSLLVGRDRPPVSTLDDTYATSSFPSGHVASAITLYGAIAIVIGVWRGRRALIALLSLTAVIAATVAFCRMYRGFHYPSDVVVGALIGVIWTTTVYLAMRPLRTTTGMDPSALHNDDDVDVDVDESRVAHAVR